MTEQARTQSVVVGIDGTQAALDAATWAVAEAVVRGTSNAPKQLYTAPK